MSHPENILIVGVNWIGDTIMSMPAIQAFRHRYPVTHITMLVKPPLHEIWGLHAVPDACWSLASGLGGTRQAVRKIRAGRFDRAYILPNSFRSAWIPWRGGVNSRYGTPGHWRRLLLTEAVLPRPSLKRRHQVFEYYDLLLPDSVVEEYEPPQMQLPEQMDRWAQETLDMIRGDSKIAIIPGAARGASKQWPAERFVELGKRLVAESSASIFVLGAPAERPLCESVSSAIGSNAISLAGKTSVQQWIAFLASVNLVVANDSGAMHVAAAFNTRTVAIFGLTDPNITGPLSKNAVVVKAVDYSDRNIPRDSVAARAALASISTDQVYSSAIDLLKEVD